MPVLIGACLGADGNGYATGETQNFSTTDGGATWQDAPAIPLVGSSDGSNTELFGVDCGSGGTIVGGGSLVAAKSANGGTTWSATSPEAFIFTMRHAASGAWLAIGPGYIARSSDGASFASIDLGANIDDELYDAAEAAPGTWWAVGVDGVMLKSTNDGASWSAVAPVVGDSLYAIRFASPLVGAAVGQSGTAIITTDGGATWRPMAAKGIDRMLGDLVWLDAGHAVVIGEQGLVLDLDVPAD